MSCCSPCDPCDPCCTPLPCIPCCSPCCSCCGKSPCRCIPKPQTFCLRTSRPVQKCKPVVICTDDCETPSCVNRRPCCPPTARNCSPCRPCPTPCNPCGPCTPCCCPRSCSPCCDRPGSACAAPSPREINNYYNRNHERCVSDNCKGSCYCPEDCCCAHRGLQGRFACPKACDPCAIIDCCPKKCCPSKCGPAGCCPENRCCDPPKCCLPKSRCPPKCCSASPCDPCCQPKCCPPRPCDPCCPPKCCSPGPCCDPCGPSKCSPSPCCDPCPPKCCDPCCPPKCCGPEPCCEPCGRPCCEPYCPPPRKPICYPPIKCCETDPCTAPTERICYYPRSPPCQPKCCPCGAPTPCDCDLTRRKRMAECCNAPCCRRCGRKVYAAEKIMASGGAFHSCCYSCYCCHKPLEVTNVFECQGEIYCKVCYCKFFGPRGYGYGATLQTQI